MANFHPSISSDQSCVVFDFSIWVYTLIKKSKNLSINQNFLIDKKSIEKNMLDQPKYLNKPYSSEKNHLTVELYLV